MAHWYAELRRHGQQTGRRVTADAVANLADFLRSGTDPKRLDGLFAPRQIQPASGPSGRAGRGSGAPVTGPVAAPAQASFPNLGMDDHGPASPAASGEAAGEALNAGQISRLNALLAIEAQHAGISPELAADVFVQALADSTQALRSLIRRHVGG
ncbi:hypothetical protein [Streptomyces goshikiensis]